MAVPWTIKKHDNYPSLIATLTDNVGVINLTTAISVKLIATSSTHVITGSCVVTDAANGIVTYNWAGGDTAFSGTYKLEFEITWPSSKKETVPNSDYASFVIFDDLDDA